jgi:Zn-dependent peptidase ImmA (M78 family)/DNA-binding XRE family transcriptional regulator
MKSIDPHIFGQRLLKFRKTAGLNQEHVARELGISRPTYIAIEKGKRAASADEVIALAQAVRRQVHELVRDQEPVHIEPHLRMGVDASASDADQVIEGIASLEAFAEDYRALERLLAAPLTTNYPPEVRLPRRGHLHDFAEDVATGERSRLQLGDKPVIGLRRLLESEVGVRVFVDRLPSRVAGLYAFVAELGCCIMVNSQHPRERRRASLIHEYGHFLVDRYKPGVDYFFSGERKPANERFVEVFGMAFLMPATGVRRRFNETVDASGDFQVGDLVRAASFFDVSVQSMTYRLEGLGLVGKGTWELLVESKFKVSAARKDLKIPESATGDVKPGLPERYQILAAQAFGRGLISEGELARYLRCDRIAARETVAKYEQHAVITDEGEATGVSLPLEQSLFKMK